MMRALPLLGVLFGCAGESEPAWGIDPIWLEASEDGVLGFQTWELYAGRWERKQDPKHFICSVVVEIEGSEIPCTDCQIAWQTTGTVVQSDCNDKVTADPTWTRLIRLSIGLEDSGADAAHPGKTSQGFADYGWGWELHGQAYPQALDHGDAEPDGAWNAEVPFRFQPELMWPVSP